MNVFSSEILETEIHFILTSAESSEIGVFLKLTKSDEGKIELTIDYEAFDYQNFNRFIFR